MEVCIDHTLDIPIEVFERIFRYCTSDDFELSVIYAVRTPMISYMLVCKRWRAMLETIGICTMPKGNSIMSWAQHGYVNLLKFTCHQDYKWPTFDAGCSLTALAAKGNHLEIIKWLNDETWSDNHNFINIQLAVNGFCEHGNIEAMEYLYNIKEILKMRCHAITAAEHGHFELVKWLHDEAKIRFNLPEALEAAAKSGNIELMEWLITKGRISPSFTRAATKAASANQLKALQWLYERGHPIDGKTFIKAIKHNNQEMMDWLYSVDCEMSAEVFRQAIKHDNLELLQWLRIIGCPWDHTSCESAYRKEYFEVLRWLLDNGCPYFRTIPSFPDKNSAAMHRWIREHYL